MKWKLLLFIAIALIVSGCSGGEQLSNDDLVNTAVAVMATQATVSISEPAFDTAAATEQPTAQPTTEPLPDPVVFDGNGASVVEISKANVPMILKISGNAGSRYFGITSFDSSGNTVGLLVNTTEPYDGIVPVDINGNSLTTRLQIDAEGSWHLELLPLSSAREISVPGSISGSGDEVIRIAGEPDLAHVIGNPSGRYFGVVGYGGFIPDLLVNTTDPYDGSNVMSRETKILVITASGDWTVEISSP